MSGTIRPAVVAILTGLLLGTVGVAAPSPVRAAIAGAQCDGSAATRYTILVKLDRPGRGTVPLRCGDASFGFVHIVGAHGDLDDRAEAFLEAAVSSGSEQAQGPSRFAYHYFGPAADDVCFYRAVVDYDLRRAGDRLPLGVITAFYEDPIGGGC
jgi:hypothetical protein